MKLTFFYKDCRGYYVLTVPSMEKGEALRGRIMDEFGETSIALSEYYLDQERWYFVLNDPCPDLVERLNKFYGKIELTSNDGKSKVQHWIDDARFFRLFVEATALQATLKWLQDKALEVELSSDNSILIIEPSEYLVKKFKEKFGF